MSKAKQKNNSGGGVLHTLSNMLTVIVAGINIALVLMLLACAMCTFISPSAAPRLGLFCLFYPFFVVANLAFILFWLVFRWKLAAIPIIGALLTLPFTQSYCPLHPIGVDKAQDGNRTLRVLTFNSRMLKGVTDPSSYDSHTFLQLLRRDSFDIIALQESEIPARRLADLEAYLDCLGYKIMRENNTKCKSNILFTRHKPINARQMDMPTSDSNRSVLFTIDIGGDTVYVANVHLESFQLEEPVKEQYRDAIHSLDPDSTESTGRFMVNIMKPKMKMHGEQIDSILAQLEPLVEQGRHVILCGDFNDSPVSYACRRARTLLTDAYRTAGSGLGLTYHEKAMYFRIDHIFASDRLRPVKTWVETTVLESDHYPLATILEILPKKEVGAE